MGEILLPVGYKTVPNVLTLGKVESLRQVIASISAGREVRRRGEIYGIRNLLSLSEEVRGIARDLVGPPYFAVRATFLDKVPGANWKITWHQDSVITVRERRDVPGFGPWSVKAGVVHVQPPPEILERMVAIRLHLDDCTRDNGALRVLPGTHRFGWIDHEVDAWRAKVPEVCCEVPCGGALYMNPLILHASSPAVRPEHRRVIHIEYARERLPGGLEWEVAKLTGPTS